MKFLRDALDTYIVPHVEKGGKFERLYPLYEAADSFLFTPGIVTRTGSHVRDGLDYKRMMSLVMVALGPCLLMALFNTGYQANLAIEAGGTPLDDVPNAVFTAVGGAYASSNPLWCLLLGALYFVPVYAVTMAAGGVVEVGFAIARKHEVNEGFLVSGALIPLIMPPTIPLWEVGLATMLGLVFAKEVFGGTGMNFLNPALVCRAILFFAYPADISGDAPWVAANVYAPDGISGATLLAQAAAVPNILDQRSWIDAFVGLVPGSMGETSTLACLLGAGIIILTGVGSWRCMAGVVIGTVLMAGFLNWAGSGSNPMFDVPYHWHMVLGGWAFGVVFMSTDPVSSSYTDIGRWFYGVGIGILCVLIRCVNPAYPEGMMLAILFMNMFAPLIDHVVIRRNVARRLARSGA